MARYASLVAWIGWLACGAAVWPSTAAEPQPPNIVLILADDLGYGHLGCYGQTKIKTPCLDRLAAQGVRFTQCYAGSRVCAPSRSTLMTGLHTGHTPIRANGGGTALWPEDVTLAEVLKSRGYATGCFGKWGLGVEHSTGHPNRQGFDEFFGYLHQVHAHFYYPYYLWRNEEQFFLPENEGRRQARYSHDEIHAAAMDFIRRHKERPFFCYIPYTIPHVELVVPEDSLAPYRGQFPEQPLPDPREGYLGAQQPHATLAGMISRMDRDIGRLLDLLDELRIADRTVVFFTSDNGAQGGPWQALNDFFQANGPLRGYKGEFYEGGIRVPLLVRWRGVTLPGAVSQHVCAFWDFLPTLAEIAGAQPPDGLDGISFVPALRAAGRTGPELPVQPTHEYLYWEYEVRGGLDQAVRLGDWKAVVRPGGKLELFNLRDDVGETTDRAAEQPHIVQRVRQILASARTPPREYPAPERRVTYRDYVR
jgi:arylsulfatase A